MATYKRKISWAGGKKHVVKKKVAGAKSAKRVAAGKKAARKAKAKRSQAARKRKITMKKRGKR